MSEIRTASYSGVRVYEYPSNGVNVMRRHHDSFINATQVLRAAGLPKPARTKVLEKDIAQGPHEKVQGGYAGFQGTWVPLHVAQRLADEHGLLEELEPLFSYDIESGTATERVSTKKKTVPKIPTFSSSYDSSEDGDLPDRPKRKRKRATVEQTVPTTPRLQDYEPREQKTCESCGAVDTPQWRRGPSGKRTLCNACGVKWSAGRLQVFTPLSPNMTANESEFLESSEPPSPLEDHEMEIGSAVWKSQFEVRQLKSKLREMERTQRKLKQLLLQAKFEDRELDRGYRRLITVAKRSHPSPDHGAIELDADEIDRIIEMHSSSDEEDHDKSTGYFGDETDRDLFHQRTSIGHFLKAVHKQKRKRMQNIRHLRVPSETF